MKCIKVISNYQKILLYEFIIHEDPSIYTSHCRAKASVRMRGFGL